MYTNADQFLNKRDDLETMIMDDKPNIILITETIPKAQMSPITKARIVIEGYFMYTNFDPDLPNLGASGTRGVTIFVADHLDTKEISFSESDFHEQLWLSLKLRGNDNLLLGYIYRSPSSSSTESTTKLCNLMRLAVDANHSHLAIIGDFNYGEIN